MTKKDLLYKIQDLIKEFEELELHAYCGIFAAVGGALQQDIQRGLGDDDPGFGTSLVLYLHNWVTEVLAPAEEGEKVDLGFTYGTQAKDEDGNPYVM
jgi:hypothetical protein